MSKRPARAAGVDGPLRTRRTRPGQKSVAGPGHTTGTKGLVMDRRLLVLALGMFALGTDSFVVAGILPQVSRGSDIAVGAAGQMTPLAMSGIFTVYTYFAVVFDRATGESAVVLGALPVLWGTCGTLSNLSAGRIIDSIGARRVLVKMLAILTADIALTPWAGEWIGTAAPVIAVWGACGWGV